MKRIDNQECMNIEQEHNRTGENEQPAEVEHVKAEQERTKIDVIKV